MTLSEIEKHFTSLEHDELADAHRIVALHQYESVSFFQRYCDALAVPPTDCYLPIKAFKDARIASFDVDRAEAVFMSSGTTDQTRSSHFVKSLAVYEKAILDGFGHWFGSDRFTILGHLPGYADSGAQSSLVFMVKLLVRTLGQQGSGLFLQDTGVLSEAIRREQPILLIGAAFGLLSLAESDKYQLPRGSSVIETGGMKTHRKELTREALHRQLAQGLGIDRDQIWSEYGMCELLSQAYRKPFESFRFPRWVSWKLFDPANPLVEIHDGPGLLGIRDLANMHTVSAILTEDIAARRGSGFEILGRLKGSELRGCNLLIESAL